MKFGASDITGFRVGADAVSRIYLGVTEVWSSAPDGPWTPADLATAPTVWLDAADADTLTLSGSDVTSWDNKGSLPSAFSQAGGGTAPEYVATGFNGEPTIDFDGLGTERFWSTSQALNSITGSNNYAVFVVGRADAAGSNSTEGYLNNGWLGDRGGWMGIYLRTSGVAGAYAWDGASRLAERPYTPGTNAILYGEHSGGSIRCRIDGGTEAATAAGALTGGAGEQLRIGIMGSADQFSLNGAISEVIILKYVPTTEERQNIEGYLATKWGLAGKLPADHPAKVPWTPGDLTGLALWLDADDAGTVTLDGSTVSQWDDKSGNNRHVAQPTSTLRPAYTTGALNGKPVLTFDGTDDFMSFQTAFGTVTQFNAIVVWRTDASGSGNFDYLYQLGNGSSALSLSVASTTAGAFNGNYYGLTNNSSPAAIDFNTPAIFNAPTITSHSIGEGTAHALWVNGGQRTVPSWPSALSADSSVSDIGRFILMNIHFLQGYIAEIVFVTNAELSTDDRQKLEGYLAHKWGLAGSLPVGHPYKDAAP